MKKRLPTIYIGIDEAGRGSLAGPVVVAGVRILTPAITIFQRSRRIKDSKKLTEKQRQQWFRIITCHPEITWAAAKVCSRVIDRLNIARAANLGARRVYYKLFSASASSNILHGFRSLNADVLKGRRTKMQNMQIKTITLLDGSLKLPHHIPHKVIVKGDEKIPLISAASIIAKVIRDRIMLRFHKRYPQYGFNLHKGYGTKLHRNMIKKYGILKIHRKSFVKNSKFW